MRAQKEVKIKEEKSLRAIAETEHRSLQERKIEKTVAMEREKLSNKKRNHKNSIFRVYTDGSAKQGASQYGGGMITQRVSTRGKPISKTYRENLIFMDSAKKHSSLSSEMAAIRAALNSLPADSVIKLHCDLKSLCDIINSGKNNFVDWAKKQRGVVREQALQLGEAIKYHSEITAIHTSDHSKYMKRVHNMAQEAASMPMKNNDLSL